MQPPARQPMTSTFRELITRTFNIYRENFMTIIGLVAFITIPISLLTIIIAPQPLTMLSVQTADSVDSSALLINLLNLIQSILITAPLTYLVSESLFNHKLTITEAFSGVSQRFTQIGCGVLLVGFILAMLGVFVIFIMLSFPPALAFGGIFIHIIVAASALMFPVLTLENINPTAAVSRSWSLGKRRFWAVMGVVLVVVVIAFIITSLIATGVGLLLTTVAPAMNSNLQFLLISIVSDVIGIFITPISPIAFTLLYYDIRTKTESLDTQLAAPATRPFNLDTPPARFQFDSHDWRNIAILSLIGLIVGVLANNLILQFIEQFTPGLK